jgi:hypothetical protein
VGRSISRDPHLERLVRLAVSATREAKQYAASLPLVGGKAAFIVFTHGSVFAVSNADWSSPFGEQFVKKRGGKWPRALLSSAS